MSDAFPPPPTPPSPQPPPNPPNAAYAPAPGASPFQPGAFQAPPPPPQKSGGCFKGCCIAAVIIGVLGLIGGIFIAMKWKQLYSKLLCTAIVDKSDLTPDEKKEAADIFEKTLDALSGTKAGDQKFAMEFQKAMNEIQMASNDGKIEGRELRPVFGRLKVSLKAAGYSFPSNLFPMIDWTVRVVTFDASRRKDVVDAIMLQQNNKVPASVVDAMLNKLPAEVLTGATQPEAEDFAKKLEAKGCEVLIQAATPVTPEAPK